MAESDYSSDDIIDMSSADESDDNEIVVVEDCVTQRQHEVEKARREKKVATVALEKKRGRPRKGKPRSEVWDHYEKKSHPLMGIVDGVEKVVGSYKKAHCKYCDSQFECKTENGTSSLKKHIEQVCKQYPGRVQAESGQQVFTSGVVGGKKSLVTVNWTQERCIEAATHMIVVDELPFSQIEKEGFKYFCSVAVPMFKVPKRGVIMKTFLRMYDDKKKELREELKSHCVSLTTDTWTSCQNINYMVVTAHFIDREWHMHKRVLAFCVIPNHEGVTIGQILESCILDWSIDKVLCISVDNASANKVAIDYIRNKMCSWEIKPILGGRLMHVRCLPHVINLIVRSGLNKMEKSVVAIRNAVRYVRGSGARLDEFKKCVEKEKVECNKICILDVPTRWNSTYMMLDTAWQLRKAFDRLHADDIRFRNYFKEDEVEEEQDVVTSESVVPNVPKKGVKRIGPPLPEDWDNAAIFVKFLKVFYDVTINISASLKPTAHKAFQDIVTVEAELEELCSIGVGPESSEADRVLFEMALQMKCKYNKYFGSLDKMNQLFLVALVLDPRYKLRYMERVCDTQLQMSSDEIRRKSDEVKRLVVELCDLYGQSNCASSGQKRKATSDTTTSRNTCKTRTLSGKRAAMLEDWDRQLEQNQEAVVGHEVDRYLLDPIEKPKKNTGEGENSEEWPILEWWKVNGDKYPNLKSLARDVFAIQVSTVASESSFSTGKRVIDPYRASLMPITVEKLICLQNWLKADSIMGLQYIPEPGEMEAYESLEAEHAKELLDKEANAKNKVASTSAASGKSYKSSETSLCAQPVIKKGKAKKINKK